MMKDAVAAPPKHLRTVAWVFRIGGGLVMAPFIGILIMTILGYGGMEGIAVSIFLLGISAVPLMIGVNLLKDIPFYRRAAMLVTEMALAFVLLFGCVAGFLAFYSFLMHRFSDLSLALISGSLIAFCGTMFACLSWQLRVLRSNEVKDWFSQPLTF